MMAADRRVVSKAHTGAIGTRARLDDQAALISVRHGERAPATEEPAQISQAEAALDVVTRQAGEVRAPDARIGSGWHLVRRLARDELLQQPLPADRDERVGGWEL